MKWVLRLGAVCLFAAICAVVLFPTSIGSIFAPQPDQGSQAVPVRVEAPSVGAVSRPAEQFRELADTEQYAIRVVDVDGVPVQGVVATLLAHDASSASPVPSSTRVAGRLQAQSAAPRTSDELGFIPIEPPQKLGGHSDLVLLTKPGFQLQAAVVDIPPDERIHEVRIQPRSLTVRVVDEFGSPQADGAVILSGNVQLGSGSMAVTTYCSFEYGIGKDGLVEVPYAPDWSVQALSQHVESIRVRIDEQDVIVLQTRPTFLVRFHCKSPVEFPEDVRFEVKGLVGTGSISLASGLIKAGSSERIARIPFVGNCRYLAYCVGEQWASTPSDIVLPSPGGEYEVECRIGGTRNWTVRVVDSAGGPIERAMVKCCWLDSAGQSKSIDKMSNHEGIVRFTSLPDSAVWFVANKAGYFQRFSVDEWTQYPRQEETLIKMESGGSLVGRVKRSGREVGDFCVWYAPEGCGWSSAFFDSASAGEFVIVGIPVGNVELVAVELAGGQSDVYRVSMPMAAERPVELELNSHISKGSCKVVDAMSGQPVEGAEVELQVQAAGTVVGGTGIRWMGDRHGEILFDGVGEGTNRIRVGGAGYESLTVSAFCAGERAVDFGQIRLRRVGALSVRILPDGPLRLEWCSIAVFGSRVLARTLFSSEGIVEYDGVPAGPARIEMLRADSVEEIIELELPEAPYGRLEIQLEVNDRMTIELSPALASRAIGGEFIYRTREGWLRRTFAASNGQSRFVVPVDPQAVEEVEIQANGMERLVRRAVSEQERRTNLVTISDVGEFKVRVVSDGGDPIGGTSVLIRRIGGDERAILDARTDDEGVAEFVGMGWDLIDVLVFHPQIGVRASERVDTRELAGRTLELELDPIGRARVAVRDGEVAIAGVQVRFLDPKYNAGRAMTDEEGVAWSLPLQEGKYRAEVGQSGYWPAAIDFECDKEEVWRTLQVRRTGGLDLEIQSASGRDVRSYVLELRSKEFEKPVAEWLGAGKVVSPQGGRPDKDGRLEVYGLPNGEYTWTAILDGAGVMAGEIEVGPHSVNKKKLFLP